MKKSRFTVNAAECDCFAQGMNDCVSFSFLNVFADRISLVSTISVILIRGLKASS